MATDLKGTPRKAFLGALSLPATPVSTCRTVMSKNRTENKPSKQAPLNDYSDPFLKAHKEIQNSTKRPCRHTKKNCLHASVREETFK